MCISILFAVLNSALLHRFANRDLNNLGDYLLFNGVISAVWSVMLFMLTLISDSFYFDRSTLLFSLIYALILCMFQFFKTMAFSDGPVALTTLISSCAFLITTAYSVCFEHDSIGAGKMLGILLLLVFLVLCIDLQEKSDAEKRPISIKWLIWTLLLFAAGGSVGIFYRLFGKSNAATHMNSMMLAASLFSAVFFFIGGICVNHLRDLPSPKLSPKALHYALLAGLTSCVYNRLNFSLANLIPGTIFFPVSNGVMVMLSALIGRFFFDEKLKGRRIVGLLLGTVAIAIIGSLPS